MLVYFYQQTRNNHLTCLVNSSTLLKSTAGYLRICGHYMLPSLIFIIGYEEFLILFIFTILRKLSKIDCFPIVCSFVHSNCGVIHLIEDCCDGNKEIIVFKIMRENIRVLTFSAIILLLYYIIYSLPTQTIKVKYSNNFLITYN